jgi:hypothetical protein
MSNTVFPDGPARPAFPATYVNKSTRQQGGHGTRAHALGRHGKLQSAFQLSLAHMQQIKNAYLAFCDTFSANVAVVFSPLQHHLCTPDCTLWNAPQTDFYFCRTSGNYHLCTLTMCRRKMPQISGDVCELTARVHPRSFLMMCETRPSADLLADMGVDHADQPLVDPGDEEEAEAEDVPHVELEEAETGLEFCDEEDRNTTSAQAVNQDRKISILLKWMATRVHCPHPSLAEPQHVVPVEVEPAVIPTRKRKAAAAGVTTPGTTSAQKRKTGAAGVVASVAKAPAQPRVIRLSRFADLLDKAVAVERTRSYTKVLQKMFKRTSVFKETLFKFTEVLENLWHLIVRSPDYNYHSQTYRLEYHVLVVMYRARKGVAVSEHGGLELVPCLPWLWQELHERGSIKSFNTSWITSAETHFNRLLAGCMLEDLQRCAEANAQIKFTEPV